MTERQRGWRGLIVLAVVMAIAAAGGLAYDGQAADARTAGYSTSCDRGCVERVKKRELREARQRRRERRRREWKRTIAKPVPQCIWLGESGAPRPGHGRGLQEFARWRYRVRNGGSLGGPIEGVAYGKFQFMPSTYRSVAKYGDWSKLDQEIAARRLLAQKGTGPWQACG